MKLDPNCPKCNAILSVVLWRLGNCPFCECELPPYREGELSQNTEVGGNQDDAQISQNIDEFLEKQLGKAPELSTAAAGREDDPAILLARDLLNNEDSFTRLAVSSSLPDESIKDEGIEQWMEAELKKDLGLYSKVKSNEMGTARSQVDLSKESSIEAVPVNQFKPESNSEHALLTAVSLKSDVSTLSESPSLGERLQELKIEQLRQVKPEPELSTEDRFHRLDEKMREIEALKSLPNEGTNHSRLSPPSGLSPAPVAREAEKNASDLAFERLEEQVLTEESIEKELKNVPLPPAVETPASVPSPKPVVKVKSEVQKEEVVSPSHQEKVITKEPVPQERAPAASIAPTVKEKEVAVPVPQEIITKEPIPQEKVPQVEESAPMVDKAKDVNITEKRESREEELEAYVVSPPLAEKKEEVTLKAEPQKYSNSDGISDFLEELDQGRFINPSKVKGNKPLPDLSLPPMTEASEKQDALLGDKKTKAEQQKQFLENDYQELSYSKRDRNLISKTKEDEPEMQDLVINKSIDDYKKVSKKGAESSKKEVKQRNKTTTPSEKINKGKSPNSMFYIRGVLHKFPFKVQAASFWTIFAWIACPVIVFGLCWVTWFAPFTEDVKKIALVSGLLAFPLVLIIYCIAAQGAKCTVCGSKQYIPRGNRKHVKAARFPMLGTLIPTAFHALFLKWFRCRDCGTPNRLKD